MEEWKTITLSEISTRIGDGIHGTPKYDDEGQYYFINGNNLCNGKIVIKDDTKRINYSEYLQHRKELSSRTLFVSINGTIGNTARYNNEPCILGKSACYINVKDDVSVDYIYYVLRSPSFQEAIGNLATGTTIKNVSLKTIRDYRFCLPPLEIQNRVSHILRSIDDKIELNNRINHNLEEQAQALYKSWFVDFEPFKDGKFVESDLGMIPEGWHIGTVEDLSTRIASGGTPKSMNADYYSGDINWFSTKELKDGFLFSSEKHITSDAVRNSAAKLFPAGTVLMAIYAAPTVGRLGILSNESTFNQAAVGISPKEDVGGAFIYLTLFSERDNLNNLASGAAQQNLNVGIVKNYKIVVPPTSVLEAFKEATNPIFQTIQTHSEENTILCSSRDNLLPRLMSGEITC